MNASFVNNDRRGRHPGKGNTPTVFHMEHSTDVVFYVGMAELSCRGSLKMRRYEA
jgi:hypothetical protein